MTSNHAHGRGHGPSRNLDALWGLRTGGDGGYYRAILGLEPLRAPEQALAELAATMVDPQAERTTGWGGPKDPPPDEGDNTGLPAAFTYVGQAIDHDLTFDFLADNHRINRLGGKVNARTPALDLDSVYGLGPEVQPYLYDGAKLALGDQDLLRLGNQAIIGDPRNDENALISRVHLALVQLHNRLVDALQAQGDAASAGELFEQARRHTRWAYQYAIVHDYLPRIVGTQTLQRVLRGPRVLIGWPAPGAIPIEWAGAAFRFGHSQIRPTYQLTPNGPLLPVFGPSGSDLAGGRPLAETGPFDWNHLVGTGEDGTAIQPSRKIDTRIAASLFGLFGQDDPQQPPLDNLALRNLRKGVLLGLPAGQTLAAEVAHQLQAAADTPAGRAHAADLDGEASTIRDHLTNVEPKLTGGTPLWYWLLEEAETVAEGHHLGPVGGRLVAEAILALLDNDPTSYWAQRPFHAPTNPSGDPYSWTDILTGQSPTL